MTVSRALWWSPGKGGDSYERGTPVTDSVMLLDSIGEAHVKSRFFAGGRRNTYIGMQRHHAKVPRVRSTGYLARKKMLPPRT